jgi:hypothetical protein
VNALEGISLKEHRHAGTRVVITAVEQQNKSLVPKTIEVGAAPVAGMATVGFTTKEVDAHAYSYIGSGRILDGWLGSVSRPGNCAISSTRTITAATRSAEAA